MQSSEKARKDPLLVAHRGGMVATPENSGPAFKCALGCPIDGIEFDVQLSSDDVPVVYHDRTLYKINGKRRHVFDYTYSELKEMDMGGWFSDQFAGERILTLEQVLKKYSGKTSLLVEIKSREADRRKGVSELLVDSVAALLKEYVAEKDMVNTYLLSFDLDVLKKIHRINPSWQCVLNVDHPALSKRVLPDWIYACGVALKKLKPGFVEYLHDKGVNVMTYSCNNPNDVSKALGLGVDVMLTDDPEWLCGHMDRT